MGGTLRLRQRRIAITTALLWLLAVEVLPNLHLAFHHDDHTHRHDGTIVRIEKVRDRGEHPHHHHDAGGHHDHGDALDSHHHHHHDHGHHHDVEVTVEHHDTRLRHEGELSIDEVPVAHAAAGIAHHALALLDPPPVVTSLDLLPPMSWQHVAPITFVRSSAPARPNARGPPAA